VGVAEPPPSCVELEESGFEPLVHSTPRPSVFEEDDDKTMIGEDSGDEVNHAPEPTPPVLPIPSPQPSSSPATSSSPVFTPQNYGRMSEANPIPVVEAPLRKKAKKLSGKATRRETFIQMSRSERKACARQAWTCLRKNEGQNYLDEKRKNIYQMQVREFYGREFESVAGLEVAPRPPAEELPDRSQAVLPQGGRPGPPPANGQGGFRSSYGGRGKPFPVRSVDSSRSWTSRPASQGKASVSHRREAGRPVEQGRFHAKVS
jgi:hypothetical protein